MKKYILICSLLIITLLLFGCTTNKKNNELIQSWLQNNIANSENYKLDIRLLSSYSEYDKERPETIPETFNTDYEVHVFKNETKARIVTKGIPEKIHYLSIEGDRVSIYRSTDNGFHEKSYNDAQLAEALAAIIFLNDVSILDGKVTRVGTTGKNSSSLNLLNVQRSVDSKPFYRPFNLLTEKEQEKGDISLIFSYDIEADTMYSFDIPNVEDLYKSMYFLFNDSEYENIYTQNNIKYDQELTIYFSSLGEPEDFELP